jgi:GTPase SAR1 family protein
MADISFKFAEKSRELNKVESRAFTIMEANERYKPVMQRIQADLGEKEKESKLRITFIGQYSAGKSTIISALTGNDNIKIDSNISTDSTTSYPWRDVLLVDTPGLYTEHLEHDAITEEAIKQADIVVYCLTFSLFDELLLKDFQKLAYERGYSGKMFLVVNKMNGEYGSYEELVGNYKKSLIKDLGEEKLNKFPLSFIVAQWQRESDPSIRKESHFDDFIVQLNDFISVNGQMAKLLGPANIFIDNIQQGIIENNDSENREFFLILDRVDRQFKKQERECDSFFLSLIDDLHTKIVNAGYQLANMQAESQSEAEEASRKVDVQMEQYCNSATQSLERKFESVQEELNSALKEISESELVMNYYAASEIKPGKVKSGVVFKKTNAANIELLNNIFSRAKDGAAGLANAAKGAKAGTGLLTASGAAGAPLHQVVLNVGHFFGATFKPWQAVNIAKGIGNFAKVLGPILIAVPVVMEAVDIVMEKQQEKKEQEHRSSLLTAVSDQANSVVQEFKDQYSEYKEKAIGENLKMIKKMRDQRTRAVKLTDKTAKELKSCVEDFKRLIGG